MMDDGIELRGTKARGDTPDEDSEHELLRKHPVDDAGRSTKAAGSGLKREITVISGVGFIVGQVIGSGIFITPRTILCDSGSFGVTMILWVAGAVIALCGAMCYIELGMTVRKSGGDYAYLLVGYSNKNRYKWTTFTGSLIAFLCSWVSVFVVRPGSIAVIILTCASYLVKSLYIGCEAPSYVITLVALGCIGKSYVFFGISYQHCTFFSVCSIFGRCQQLQCQVCG